MSRRNMSPKEREQARRRRNAVFMVAGLSFLFYLVISFFFGEMGVIRYVKLTDQRDELAAEIKALERSNEELAARVEALKTDPASIEELAREQGLVKEGEIVYQYEDKDQKRE